MGSYLSDTNIYIQELFTICILLLIRDVCYTSIPDLKNKAAGMWFKYTM